MDQKTEVQLLAELAAAPTQAEQHRIAADLEGLRRTSALRVESSAMWEVDDAPTWQATERPQVLTYATRESDWLADVEEQVVDPAQMDVQMRSEASHWYSHSMGPLTREDPHEILVQATRLAHHLGSQYGDDADKAAQTFMDQVRHHATTDGKPLPSTMETMPGPHVPLQQDTDTESASSETPSMENGDKPEDDHAPDGSPPIPDGENFDAATWPTLTDWGKSASSQRKEARTATCKNCGEPIREDDNGSGGKVWVHDFGSTVCHDNPPGSVEDGDTTTTAEPKGKSASRKTAGLTFRGEEYYVGAVGRNGSPKTAQNCQNCGREVFNQEAYVTAWSDGATQKVLCRPCGDDVERGVTASRKTAALSEADKAKVIPPMGYEVTREDVEAAMALPSGSRPRIYAYWDNGTGSPQVVKITSQHYLDKYGPDVEFYWGTNATMDNIGDWMVSRASRKTATDGVPASTCSVCGAGIEQEKDGSWSHDVGNDEIDHEAKPVDGAWPETSRRAASRKTALAGCSCAHNTDGTVTTMLCPLHATEDPCWTMARVTGRRRKGSIVRGVCTNCGWGSTTASRKTAAPRDGQRSYCRICGVEMEGMEYNWYALKASAPQRDVGQHHHLPARNADWPGEFNAQGDLVPGTPGGGGGQYDAPAGTIYDAGGKAIRVASRKEAVGIYERVVFEQGDLRLVDMSDTPSAKNFRVEEDWGGGEWGTVEYPDSEEEGRQMILSRTASRRTAGQGILWKPLDASNPMDAMMMAPGYDGQYQALVDGNVLITVGETPDGGAFFSLSGAESGYIGGFDSISDAMAAAQASYGGTTASRKEARRTNAYASLASKVQVGAADRGVLKALASLKGPQDSVGGMDARRIAKHLLAVGQMDGQTRSALTRVASR